MNESENVYVYVSVKCSTFIILMEWGEKPRVLFDLVQFIVPLKIIRRI